MLQDLDLTWPVNHHLHVKTGGNMSGFICNIAFWCVSVDVRGNIVGSTLHTKDLFNAVAQLRQEIHLKIFINISRPFRQNNKYTSICGSCFSRIWRWSYNHDIFILFIRWHRSSFQCKALSCDQIPFQQLSTRYPLLMVSCQRRQNTQTWFVEPTISQRLHSFLKVSVNERDVCVPGVLISRRKF